MTSLIGFVVAFSVAVLTTPLFRRLALRYRIFAHTNERTVHRGLVPKLGGAAITLAFLSGTALWGALAPEWSLFGNIRIFALALGAMAIFVLGTLDDKYDLDCNLKLVVELLVASFIVIVGGWRIESAVFPCVAHIDFSFFAYPLTVLWIVGVSNAVNLIDGLDEFTHGIAITVALVNISIGLLLGNLMPVYLNLILAGSVAGFLLYNINPALIFMGDSGSLTVGLILACLSIESAATAPGQIAILVPIVLLGIPLTDTTLAIVRRLRRGIHPFHADQEHIHHRLVRLGLSQSGAALFMVGLSLILGILAFLLAHGIHTDLELFSFLGIPD